MDIVYDETMLVLTSAVQQLIGQVSVVLVGAILAIMIAALLIRQLDLFGFKPRYDE